MPYRKYSYRRRYRKRSYPRTGYGATDYIKMARTAYNGVKYLKSLVNVEKHPLDVNFNETPTGTATFTCLNLIAQGDDESNRSGNSVLMRSVNVNLKYAMSASATHTSCRTILFFDKECNGVTPLTTELLVSSITTSNYQHQQASRFQILADFTVNLSITGMQETTRRIYRRLQRHAHYDGTGAIIGDVVDYALWIMLLSDEATNAPTVIGRSQLLFIDN